MTRRKPITEWRVVCARFGEPGHGQHHKEKRTLKAAEDCVDDFAKDIERLPDRTASLFYINEHPKRIQTRTVTEWTDA